MSEKPVLSPKELALVIGVSESSLKRWADDGLIRVTRTAGGHRRIPLSEAIRFIRESNATVVRPELLGFPEVKALPQDDDGDEAQRLFRYLETGQDAEARGLLFSLYLKGASVAEICDGPIRAAMARLGELYQHSDSGIATEHRATDICIQALNQLRLSLNPPLNAPVAIGGAPSGDPYIIPSLVTATVLMSCDWRAMNLGADTPLSVLGRAAEENRAQLIWVSISSAESPSKLANDIASLANRARSSNSHVVVGGRMSGNLPLPGHDAISVCPSMQQLVALVTRLRQAQPATDADSVAS